MSGILVSVVLISSLVLVHFSVRAQPISKRRPLNVDRNLPLPEVGQASTVFSLTALFGSYLAVYILLGLTALAGLACGTIAGLISIRFWILKSDVATFEEFITKIFDSRNGRALGYIIALTQCGYAASELIILHQISSIILGMRSDHAILFAAATGVVGYYYILVGGYIAVYRTDILQFLLVGVMALALTSSIMTSTLPIVSSVHALPRPGYWELIAFNNASRPAALAYHFIVGAIMGFGLLAAAPDAWKRVFVVTTSRQQTLGRFLVFIAIGTAPFISLLPLGLLIPTIPDGPVDLQIIFSEFPNSNHLFVFTSLGLIACFLSAFNSALLAAVHVGIILRRTRYRNAYEMNSFYWLIATSITVVYLLFICLCQIENPYMLANFLLGPYAMIAGIQAGTQAAPSRLPHNFIIWILAIGSAGWTVLFAANSDGLPVKPTTFEVNTIPSGAGLFLVIAIFCRVFAQSRSHHARPSSN